MKNKLILFEKLSLNEDTIDNITPIKKLIKAGKWDEALDLAGDVRSKFYQVEYKFDEPINDQQDQNDIIDICNQYGVEVTFNNNELIFIGENNQKVANAINDLDDEELIPEKRDTNYIQPDAADLQKAVAKYYLKTKKLINKLSGDDTIKLASEIFVQLGLNEYDNPFINYFKEIYFKLTKDNLIALNNTYLHPVEPEWLNSTSAINYDILFNATLFKQIPQARQLIDIIDKYGEFHISNDSDRAKRDSYFMNDKRQVYPYQTIIKNLSRANLNQEIDNRNDVIYLTDRDINNINIATLSKKSKEKLIDKINKSEQ